MKLDTLSKQCIIVAAFAIILSICFTVIELYRLGQFYRSDYENLSQYTPTSCLKLAACVAATLISVLKIIGIKQRSAIFVAPWVLAAFGALAYYIYDIVATLMSHSYFHIDVAFYPIVVFGVACIIMYPLLTVFADIRRERANAVKQLDQNKCDFLRI